MDHFLGIQYTRSAASFTSVCRREIGARTGEREQNAQLNVPEVSHRGNYNILVHVGVDKNMNPNGIRVAISTHVFARQRIVSGINIS